MCVSDLLIAKINMLCTVQDMQPAGKNKPVKVTIIASYVDTIDVIKGMQ